MTQAQFFDWAGKLEGGCMNDAAMAQEWTTVLNAKGWKPDHKARNGEVRLGVITGDRLDIYNRREEAQKLTHGTKAAKPLSHEDEQEVMANRVDKGHASFGGCWRVWRRRR